MSKMPPAIVKIGGTEARKVSRSEKVAEERKKSDWVDNVQFT